MTSVNQILRRVEGVQTKAHAEGSGIESLGIEVAHQLQGLLAGLDGTYLLQIRQNRLIAHLVTAYAVNVKAIKRTNFLPVAALWQIFLVGIFHNQRVDALIVLLFQVNESTVHGVLLVQWVVLQPCAHGILPEVVTRFYTLVKIRFQVLCHTCQTYKGKGYGHHQFFHHIC